MKTIFSIALSMLLLTSCQPSKEKLQLNLSKGETYYQKIVSDMSLSQTINGQEMKINMVITGATSYKVLDIQDTIYDMQVQYENLSMKMTLPNGTMEFSTEKNDESDIFSTILKVLKNKSFYIKLTKTGKINEVKNIDSLFLGIFEKFPEIPEEQKMQIQNQLLQAYGEKSFKGNFEMAMAIFPSKEVLKGDKWTINTQLETGMSGNMETTYELTEIASSFYLIKGDSKITTADKDAYIPVNGMPVKYDLTGTMLSNIKIDKTTGWTIEAKISQNITGYSEIKDNPQMPGGMKIPLAMKNEMTITEK